MSPKWTKIGLLLITLALPVGLYLFLQSFGENQYTVPIFYETGIDDPPSGCPENTNQHAIGEALLQREGTTPLNTHQLKGRFTVFNFAKNGCDTMIIDELGRICNQYRAQKLVHVATLSLDTLITSDSWKEKLRIYGLKPDSWSWIPFQEATMALIRCGLNLSASNCIAHNQLVLVDDKLRIRGYYDARDIKEVDRLATEIEILLLNKEND